MIYSLFNLDITKNNRNNNNTHRSPASFFLFLRLSLKSTTGPSFDMRKDKSKKKNPKKKGKIFTTVLAFLS